MKESTMHFVVKRDVVSGKDLYVNWNGTTTLDSLAADRYATRTQADIVAMTHGGDVVSPKGDATDSS